MAVFRESVVFRGIAGLRTIKVFATKALAEVVHSEHPEAMAHQGMQQVNTGLLNSIGGTR